MAKKTTFTRKNGKTISSDFIYPNEMIDGPGIAGVFKGDDIDIPKLSKKEQDKISKESFDILEDETEELRVGNMQVKMVPVKTKPRSKKKILADAAKAKRNHRKMNHTRTAASLRARKMKPCKK